MARLKEHLRANMEKQPALEPITSNVNTDPISPIDINVVLREQKIASKMGISSPVVPVKLSF